MAKVASPYGLRPLRRLDGLPYAGEVRHFPIASGYATDILPGDLVKIVGGNVERVTGTTVDETVVGVFMGCAVTDTGQTPVLGQWNDKWVGGTTATNPVAYVVDDPYVQFQIQANGQIDADKLGKNFAILNPGSSTKLSDIQLDSAGSSGGPFKVVDFVRTNDSQPNDDYTDVIVKFNPNAHCYLTGTEV